MTIPYDLATAFVEDFKKNNKAGTVIVAGSYRRKKEMLNDIDILYVSKGPSWDSTSDPLKDAVLKNVINQTDGKLHKIVNLKWHGKDLKVDMYLVNKISLPYFLLHATGDKLENIRMRRHAQSKGWLLNQYGLWKGKTLVDKAIKTEKNIYDTLGLPYKTPQNRNNIKGAF